MTQLKDLLNIYCASYELIGQPIAMPRKNPIKYYRVTVNGQDIYDIPKTYSTKEIYDTFLGEEVNVEI